VVSSDESDEAVLVLVVEVSETWGSKAGGSMVIIASLLLSCVGVGEDVRNEKRRLSGHMFKLQVL